VAGTGHAVPVTGWLSGLVLIALGAVLLVLGLPLYRYMKESEERREHPTSVPRKHTIDLPTAFRTILLARACALTGAVAAGLFLGQFLFLLGSGTGATSALFPTGFATLCAVALAVLGVIVERWGTLPPEDGDSGAASPASPAS
jgi:hypothetical protein